jgi:aminoethylphosphonate catabolism LysR family transcriptional regulator
MSMIHAHLRAFHGVAIHGSFTQAARMLHVTQPTLSGQVKALEERYGVKLFERRGHGIELTEFGQAALAITRQLFRHEAEVEQLFLSARELITGTLRVGADSPYFITPLLAQFHRRYPGIHLSIITGNSRELMKSLETHRCEIAVLPNVPTDDQRLHAIALAPDKLVVFTSMSHAWAERRSIRIEELADERIVLRESGSTTRSIFEAAMKEANVPLDDTIEISGREGVREAVAAGLGIGVVSENEFGNDTRLHALTVKNALLEHDEYVVCLEKTRSMRVVSAFLDIVETTQNE